MLTRGLIQRDQENIIREPLSITMDHLTIGKNHLGAGLTQPLGASNEGSGVLNGTS